LNPQDVRERVAGRSRSVAQGFAQFLLRGKVSDLAVAVVIGAAIGALVSAFVKDIFMPLVSALFGSHAQFSGRSVPIRGEKLLYGDFLNQLVSFIAIATVVYFFVLVPMNKLVSNAYFAPPPDPATRKCPECLSEIPKAARRCTYCTSEVPTLDDTVVVERLAYLVLCKCKDAL